MPLHVIAVEPGSPAETVGIKNGAVLYSINSRHLEDILDYYYLIEDGFLEIEYQNPEGERQTVSYQYSFMDSFGLSFKAPECKECINQCVFCFVDQMPDGMRKSLYVKDDDYLFSFMYGNFVTLTNLTDHYLDKIIEQHVSPLYVSVHTTNPDLHQKMLRYNRSFNVIDTLRKLADQEIEMQTQIVLVPDWNDKIELHRTLSDLTNPDMNISSIGIVPVGLTRFREKLSPLRSFSKEECRDVIHLTKDFRKNGFPYLYCSDEFFLQAEMNIPSKAYYNEFEQIENGIGMVRKSWDNYRNRKRRFYKMINLFKEPVCFVTGESGHKVLKPIVKDMNKHASKKENLIEKVENDFFGHSVTVSGLLTWTDVQKHIPAKSDYIYAFSGNFFNFEDVTLDNYTITDISNYLKNDFLIIDPLFLDYRLIPYQKG
ncbi:MAG TPA: DUF512 domain-containing protein [Candidatus Cloacimonadota bacterium]|nr:DUF512 domain-containing protein [Candidatus Cloacimonadota bacterium]